MLGARSRAGRGAVTVFGRRRPRAVTWCSWALLASSACGAGPGEPSISIDILDDPATEAAVMVPMRRLGRDQYHHTVHDLLGDALPGDVDVRARLPHDDEHGGFVANATVPMTELAVQQLQDAAQIIADAVVPRRDRLHPCLGEPSPGGACLQAWIDQLGPRAFRRPLSAAEREALHALVEPTAVPATVEQDSVEAAVERALLALLQSPDFLYRIDRGDPSDDLDAVPLTDFEIASRLSYLLWGTMPDDALWEQASDGLLRDPEVRDRAAVRMLADPRAREGLAAFHRQWLELDGLSSLRKDRNRFPTFDEALGPLLQQEFETFIELTLLSGPGTLTALLTSRVTAVPAALAPWYGDDAVPTEVAGAQVPEGFDTVALHPARRSGVLTLVPTMAAHAKAGRSDPVGRGAVVRRRLLCDTLAAAPPDVPTATPQPMPQASQRDQLQQHSTDPACAGCHALTDPVGLMFETYDAMGVFRVEDFAGNPVDARGAVPGSDITGELDDAVELAAALATSAQVRRCYATQWLRHALGRPDGAADADLDARMQQALATTDGHVPSMLRALVSSDAFAWRRSVP